MQLLTPEDSKRIADAVIEKIQDADWNIAEAVQDAVRDVLVPEIWKPGWLPCLIEDMCNQISRGVVAAAYEASEKISRDAGDAWEEISHGVVDAVREGAEEGDKFFSDLVKDGDKFQ